MTGEFQRTPPREHFALRFLTPAGRARLFRDGPTPIPASGETNSGLTLRLAGIDVTFRGLEDSQIDGLRAAFADHFGLEVPSPGKSSTSPSCWRIDCVPALESWFHTSSEASAGEEFWEYFLDVEPAQDHVQVAGLDLFARLYRPPHRRLVAWLPRGLAGGRLEQAVHNLLRVATAFAVADAGGLLLHSSTLVAEKGGVAVVCPGRSGAGKSTLSGRARDLGWQVLSDELNVVWMGDDSDGSETSPQAEQVPFTGDLGRLHRRPGRFPIAAVLPIVRTGRDECPSLSPAELYARVLAEAVFANADPQTAPRLEATVERLVCWAASRGRLESLSFTPDGRLDALQPLFEPDLVPCGAKAS